MIYKPMTIGEITGDPFYDLRKAVDDLKVALFIYHPFCKIARWTTRKIETVLP